MQVFYFTSSDVFIVVALVDPEMFPRHEVVKREKQEHPEPSPLSVLLAEYSKISANPFYKFSKFNGEVSDGSYFSLVSFFPSFFPFFLLLLENVCTFKYG